MANLCETASLSMSVNLTDKVCQVETQPNSVPNSQISLSVSGVSPSIIIGNEEEMFVTSSSVTKTPVYVNGLSAEKVCVSPDNEDIEIDSSAFGRCSCPCRVLVADLEGIKLDIQILQKQMESKPNVNTGDKSVQGDENNRLKLELFRERERCNQLEKDMYLIIQERNAEMGELNKVIRSLEDRATKAEEAKNSLRCVINLITQGKNDQMSVIEEEIIEKSENKRGEVLRGEEIVESSISEEPSALTLDQQFRVYREKQHQKFIVQSQKRHDNPHQRRQQQRQQRKQRRSSNSENQKKNNQGSFQSQPARFKEPHHQQSTILSSRERKSGLKIPNSITRCIGGNPHFRDHQTKHHPPLRPGIQIHRSVEWRKYLNFVRQTAEGWVHGQSLTRPF